MSTFIFPILNKDSILQCLQELNIPLTAEEYKNPQPEQIRDVYFTLVQFLMGIDSKSEQFQQPKFEGLQTLDFPDLHNDSLPQLALTQALFRLMTVCGVKDFSLRDLIQPDYPRTRRNLSAIINFWKFREERLENFNKIRSEMDYNEQIYNEKLQQMKEIKSQVETYRQQDMNEESEVNKLEHEIESLSAEVNDLNQLQAKLQMMCHEKKENTVQLNDQVSVTKFKILEIKERIDNLQRSVISSPKRVKREIAELAKTVVQQKDDILDMERASREMLVRLDSLNNVYEDLTKAMKCMDEFEEEVKKHKTHFSKNEELRESIKEKQQEYKNCRTTEQQLIKANVNYKERTQRLRQDQKNKEEELAKKNRELNIEKENLTESIQQKRKTYNIQKQHYDDIEANAKKEINQMITEYGKFSDKINNYVNTLQELCQN